MIFLPSAKFLYRPQTTVAPWTPLSLGNTVLYGWYKADAGVPVSTDGASVATWADQSATPHNLTQSTPANRPVFRTAANGINGIPVLEFPSSATTPAFLNETAFTANTNGFSFYIVSRNAAYSASAQYTGMFLIGGTSQGGVNQFCNHPSFPTAQKIRINGLSLDFGEPVISSKFVVTKASRGITLDSVKYRTTYTALETNGSSNPYVIPPGFSVGRNFIGSVGGQVAEVIVCNRELTTGADSEEASLDAYFRSRYGFSLYYGADLPVTGPALWLDASRMDALYTDNALTTAATTDNGPVGGWKDLSGNNRHALQTGTNRPTWRTPVNGLNGLGVMSFNGSNQWIVGDWQTYTDLTLFIVARNTNASSPGGRIFSQSDNTLADNVQTPTTTWIPAAVSSGPTLVSTSTAQAAIMSVSFTNNTYQKFIHRKTGTTGSNTVGSTTVSGTIGSVTRAMTRYCMGRSTNGSDGNWAGQVSEVIAFPRSLNSTEETAVSNYLNVKWGTS